MFLFVLFSFTYSEIYITTSEGIAFEVCSEKKKQKQAAKGFFPNSSGKTIANLLAPAQAQGRLPELKCYISVLTRRTCMERLHLL